MLLMHRNDIIQVRQEEVDSSHSNHIIDFSE